MKIVKTAERIPSIDVSDNFVFQRSLLAYKKVAEIVYSKILKFDTRSSYGIAEVAPNVEEFCTLDKYYVTIDYNKYPNMTTKRY